MKFKIKQCIVETNCYAICNLFSQFQINCGNVGSLSPTKVNGNENKMLDVLCGLH